VLVASLHLGTFLITTLFAYWALHIFSFHRSRALSVTLYAVAVIVIGVGLFYFASVAYRTLPKNADLALPAMVDFAEKHGIDLPFTLNSKIVGRRIDSPVWLTLIGLLVGERLMGIPGLILAPVILHYIGLEASAHHPLSAREPVPVLTTVRSNLDPQKTDLAAD
jgi:predicted PurR-regulated permease PerM